MSRAIILILFLLSATSLAQDMPTLRCEWGAPFNGSPVVVYIIEFWDVDTDEMVWTATTSFTAITIPDSVVVPDHRYYARVCGVDDFGRQGTWTEPLIYLWDTGPPGAPTNFRWVEER